ncbi:MAG: InlB B-repeat-containing protein [Clostridia bacterium]|nr:InlB B-repeat-containing protein [Clostridia bacterium]
MKKFISLLLALLVLLTLTACGGEDTSSLVSEPASSVLQQQSADFANPQSSSGSSSKAQVSEPTEDTSTVVAGEYTVTFDYGYDNKKITAKSQSYKVAKPEEPTRSGYIFMGWYTANESERWNFTGYAVTSDMALIAKWKKYEYYISYSMIINGSWSDYFGMRKGRIIIGRFQGYSVTVDDGTELIQRNLGSLNIPSGNYDVHYFRVPSNFSVDSKTFTVPELEFEDFEFLGWTYEGQTTPVKTVTIPKGTTKDYKLIANWKRK